MKLKYLYVLILILIITLLFTYLYFYSNQPGKEGATTTNPTPTDFPWDYEYLNQINESLDFNKNQNDPNNARADLFINHLINKDIKYSKVEVPPSDPKFPEYGEGVCMTDWSSVTDNTNNTNGSRTVRMKDGTVLKRPNDVNQVDGQIAYNECLEFANEQKKEHPSINVFAIQYGGECFVGDTNYLALNSDVTTTDNRTRDKNQVQTLYNKNYCKRDGIVPGTGTNFRWWGGSTINIGGKPFASTNGSGWTQMVYAHPLPKTMYRFDDNEYTNKIKEYSSNGLKSYISVLDSIRLNNGFTTMESFVEGLDTPSTPDPTSTPVAVGNPITNLKGIPGVDNNLINKLIQNNFIVTTEEYATWISQIVDSIPLNLYLEKATNFGLNSVDQVHGFLSKFQTFFGIPIELPQPVIYVIVIMLGYFHIGNIEEYNSFEELVKNIGLNKVPYSILKSNQTAQGNLSMLTIIYYLALINVYWNDYKTFFSVWNQNKIGTNDTMNIIVNILTNETFSYQYNGNTTQLTTLIQFATYSNIDMSLKIPTPVEAFTKFNETLQNMKITYAAYINYYNTLQNIVGIQPNMKSILSNFATYYNTVAYSDVSGHVLDKPVTINTLFNEFIYIIDQPGSSVPPYFTPTCAADFNEYLKKITKAPFTVANIITQKNNYNSDDTTTGETYCKFMTRGSGSNESFETYTQTNAPEDILSTIYNYITKMFRKFTQIEGATTNISDSVAWENFFGSYPYADKYDALINDLKSRNLSGSDNIASFVNSLLDANIYYTDYNTICRLFDQFNGGTTMPIETLKSIIASLSKIGVKSSSEIVQFIGLISNRFGVSYSTNFNTFLNDLTRFNMGSNDVNMNAATKFINDMIQIGLTYATPQGTQKIESIITYLIHANLPLVDYYNGPASKNTITSFNNGTKKCDIPSLPANFPSLFITSLYKYNTTSYASLLYDIFNQTAIQNVEHCDIINAMQDAYMITSSLQTYNNSNALIVPNVKVIASFVYQEEMSAIVNQPNYYNNVQKRISMINDIADGMIKYSAVFKDGMQHDFEMHNKIAKFMKIFPVLSFQYLSNEFIEKCSNGNECWYSIYVDPTYSECKASTSKKTTNYRPNPPVL